MSAQGNNSPSAPPPRPSRPRRSIWVPISWLAGGSLVLLILLVGGLLFFASTPQFANIVRKKVIAVLESSTGGRVELQSFRWSLMHLSVEADNLTIHGLEGPNEIPYAHIDRLYARAKIVAFFQPKVDLNYLEADRPVFHLIVYPGGGTNQPEPRHQAQGSRSTIDTIFDLGVQRTEVHNGLAIANQRAIPFNFSADDLAAIVTYSAVKDRYLAEVRISDLDLQRGPVPPLRSKLTLQVELARNEAVLRALHFVSGASKLDASGSLTDFSDPAWRVSTQGGVDLRELAALVPIEGLRQGTADIKVQAQGTGAGQFLIGGDARLTGVGFQTDYLSVSGVRADTRFRVTPDEIALDGLRARLREGGSVDATLRFEHWNGLSASPGATPKRASGAIPGTGNSGKPSASIRARVHGVGLPTVLKMVAVRRYWNLGFDTVADGAVEVDWTGSGSDLTVAARMQLSAPGVPASGEAPLSGFVDAKYFERDGKVRINQFEGHTPGSGIQVTGVLAVYPITGSSALNVNLNTTNLVEFDRVLTDLSLAWNGKTGVAAIPVRLQGAAEFSGTVTGSLIDPDVKGHLTATNFSTEFSVPAVAPSAQAPETLPVALPAPGPMAPGLQPESSLRAVHWDRLDATAEYSPSLISIQQATLSGEGAEIDIQGRLQAHSIGAHGSAFDDLSTIDATAAIHKAPVTDLLALTGQSFPVSGTVNLQLHAGGSLGNLNGGGNLQVQGGEIVGEPYHSITSTLSFVGSHLNLVKATLLQDGGTLIANGTYDLQTRTFLANLDGTHFELAHFHHLQGDRIPVGGSLKFDAHASGTLQAPSILLGVHLTNLVVQGQPIGGLEGVAHTQGDIAYFDAHSTLVAARLELSGQTKLHGNFDTQAKLIASGLDIDPLLRAFNVQSLSARSVIGGTIDLSGPLKAPAQFSGNVEIGQFSVTMQGITLNSQGPLRASLQSGVVRITQAHITGPDTNIVVSGSAGLIGGRNLNLGASGSVNMKLAQTFDPDITASGHVDFNVEAGGVLMRPLLTGQVRLTKVAMALNDLPNGISNLNGTLVFDQDRLEVRNLEGSTGGGQIKLTGFITYQQGIYADLTATGKDNRVRYSGLSATADTTLRLQGSKSNMLLAGSVLITRFIIGPNFDFAVFAGAPAASALPNPNAPSSHVRLDIHITSSPQLDFQNSYAQLAGSVDLRIRGTIAQPAVLGRINISEGTANFAGTSYQLQHGDIYFTNPVRIDPLIDLDATTRIEEYDVTIGLHGSASHLSPTFRSEPPLPQADVISLLALGRTQQEQQIYSAEQEQAGMNTATNALLGGALNAAVGSRVQRLFGVGSVKIDPTYLGNLGNSTARITVQQNISRTVELTYATNVNTTAEQLIQAQVNLTQNVSLLAVRDESDVFSVVLKVHQRFR